MADTPDFIPLSDAELSVLTNKEFMPLKYSASVKIEQVLKALRDRISRELDLAQKNLPHEIQQCSPKISRGENYHTYAYRVLDYPRVFRREDIFTFRSLVLWGHYIAFHLLLTGEYKKRLEGKVLDNLSELPAGAYLSQENIPWQWFRNEQEQLPLEDLSRLQAQKVLNQRKFLKASIWLPLDRYVEIPEIGAMCWRTWQGVLFET